MRTILISYIIPLKALLTYKDLNVKTIKNIFLKHPPGEREKDRKGESEKGRKEEVEKKKKMRWENDYELEIENPQTFCFKNKFINTTYRAEINEFIKGLNGYLNTFHPESPKGADDLWYHTGYTPLTLAKKTYGALGTADHITLERLFGLAAISASLADKCGQNLAISDREMCTVLFVKKQQKQRNHFRSHDMAYTFHIINKRLQLQLLRVMHQMKIIVVAPSNSFFL